VTTIVNATSFQYPTVSYSSSDSGKNQVGFVCFFSNLRKINIKVWINFLKKNIQIGGPKHRRRRKKHHSKAESHFERRQGGARKKSCFKQTCQQSISGRNLNYQKALDVIQNEDYLNVADKDSILKYRRFKRTLEADENAIQNENLETKTLHQIFEDSLERIKLIKIICDSSPSGSNQTLKNFKRRSRIPRQLSQFVALAQRYCSVVRILLYQTHFK